MFKKSKQFSQLSVLELKQNHYYIIVVKDVDKVKEVGEALDKFLGKGKDAPMVLLLPADELESMRVVEIG